MIKFFRKIRQNMVQQNKVRKYILYALGEIILVVIGILIALQINNWNEQRKSNVFQEKILKEIKTSMEQDLKRTKAILNYRAERKKQAISDLIDYLHSSDSVPKAALRESFSRAGITLSFYFDKGPFESLKAKGLENITNDSIRSQLIRFYEVSLPLDIIFVDYDKENYAMRRKMFRDKLVNNVYKKQDTIWRVLMDLELDYLKKSKDFKKWLELEQTVSDNYVVRLENIIKSYQKMIIMVENELKILE